MSLSDRRGSGKGSSFCEGERAWEKNREQESDNKRKKIIKGARGTACSMIIFMIMASDRCPIYSNIKLRLRLELAV